MSKAGHISIIPTTTIYTIVDDVPSFRYRDGNIYITIETLTGVTAEVTMPAGVLIDTISAAMACVNSNPVLQAAGVV